MTISSSNRTTISTLLEEVPSSNIMNNRCGKNIENKKKVPSRLGPTSLTPANLSPKYSLPTKVSPETP